MVLSVSQRFTRLHALGIQEQPQGTKFLFQFEAYAASVKESLMTSEAQRQLNRESREVDLLEKMAKLELTREEWEELKSQRSQASADFVIARKPQADEAIYGFQSHFELIIVRP